MTSNKLFNHITFVALSALLAILLTGCGRYAISVNERTVYEPAPLFGDYSIADAALKSCVKATIAEKQLTKAEQLKQLICPPGEISSLAGIQVFINLEHVGLASNQLRDISSLSLLKKLTRVNLRDNNIENFTPLHTLEKLNFLDARENDKARCNTLTALTKSTTELALPEACK